ncbi:thioesterase II family protein [Streptomyces sedi]|uniref:thioesterase II family protein n=1 Tax=Streptomyces sedi TaxID=555059 RepID=UPI001476BAC7|nr:alpha/beta fold hydrolase [Streptomyces sedi]
MTTRPLRLFCLPHAGGSAVVYHPWRRGLARVAEVVPTELPGHGTRRGEPLSTDLRQVVADLTARVRPLVNDPFALFGHSFGALLAFELARELTAAGTPPSALLVSGRDGPAVPAPGPAVHALPTARLLDRLRLLDGIPPALARDGELLELLLPPLRADMKMVEEYVRAPGPSLTCPIWVAVGSLDPIATAEGQRRWAEETSAPCRLVSVAAGHMLLDHPGFLRELTRELASHSGR